MRLRVLGCSGGIAANCLTTSYLVNDNILLDGGTGVGELSLDEMSLIKHVFLTHTHLDHIAGLALMLASIYEQAASRITVYAPESVLNVLEKHLFNWEIWPDFTQLPNSEDSILSFQTLCVDEPCLVDDFKVQTVLLSHTVESFAYILKSGHSSLCFCGDTGPTETLWNELNKLNELQYLIVEVSYPNEQLDLAVQSGHHTPQTLFNDIKRLTHDTKICVHHMKPGNESIIINQCETLFSSNVLKILEQGDMLDV